MGSKPRLWGQQIRHHPVRSAIIIATGILCIALIVLIVVGYWLNWPWIGVNGGYSKITITSTVHGTTTAQEQPQTRTLWDWLQLLIIPASLGIFGVFLTNLMQARSQRELAEQQAQSQHELMEQQAQSAQKTLEQQASFERELAEQQASFERELAERQAQHARELATDSQREGVLQAYFDKISGLLIHEGLRQALQGSEVRNAACVQTITVLLRLDGSRKGNLIRFLYKSGLIDKIDPIIDLQGADLRNADLRGADLRGADLRGTNMRGTDLREIDLRGADLGDSDLAGADLRGALSTQEQWEKARSLTNAIMPDGAKHP